MVWGKCPGHDGDRAGEPRKVRGPQARDWWRGAPGVDGGSCRPGAARHSKSSAPGRVSRGTAGCAACRPPAHRPAAPLRLPAERRALVQHCRYRSGRPRGHPARCPWHRHRPRRPRPGWASPHPRRRRGWSIWIGAAISTRMTDVRAAAQLSALASLLTIAVPSLIAFNVIHATLALAVALLLDGLRLADRGGDVRPRTAHNRYSGDQRRAPGPRGHQAKGAP